VKLSATDRLVARKQIEGVADRLDLRVEAIEEKRRLLATAISVTLRGDSQAIEDFRAAMCSDGLPAGTDPLPGAPINSGTSAVINAYNAIRRARWRAAQRK
jgi:hypothetical protein